MTPLACCCRTNQTEIPLWLSILIIGFFAVLMGIGIWAKWTTPRGRE